MRVDPDSFDDVYRSAEDPWAFTTSPYELAKYDTTVGSLASTRYQRCFEPACSIGALTERLASRVDAVVACDASATAIARASARLSGADNVELFTAAIPEWWPSGTFDLIVLSELGYYWDINGWRDIIARCREALNPHGEIISVHWLGTSPDHILSGTTVHDELSSTLGPPDLHLVSSSNTDDAPASGYVLDRWTGLRHEQ